MFTLFSNPTNGYRLLVRLRRSQGPINCLAFTKDGKYLASGGDDQALTIWDVVKQCPDQVLKDQLGRWGQVTSVKWLSGQPESICFGTGRGLLLLYQRSKGTSAFKELSNTSVFPFNDAVEAFDYDRSKARLVVCSHTGKLKAFVVEKTGSLTELWHKEPEDGSSHYGVIPRGLSFISKGDTFTTFGLQSGSMTSRDTANGQELWSKTLLSSIGNAMLSYGGNYLLVDNLVKGFDLYQYPRTSPIESFSIPRKAAYVMGALFIEGAEYIGCGSDHGIVYLFSIETGQSVGKLKHGSKNSMIQVLEACTTSTSHLIASGSADHDTCICIWEKKASAIFHFQSMHRTAHEHQSSSWGSIPSIIILNILLVLFCMMILGSDNLVNHFQRSFSRLTVPPAVDVTERAELYAQAQEALRRFKIQEKERGYDNPQWVHKLLEARH